MSGIGNPGRVTVLVGRRLMHESGDRIIAQAESSSGRIKVLEDRVRIERNAYIPGQTSGDDEFANGRIDNAWLQEPKMFGEGRIVISADAGAVRSRLSFGREEAEAFRTVARVIRERVAPREPAAVPGETER